MSHAQNNSATWKPSAPLKNIQARAELYACIRRFFSERQVLEVETPLLDKFGVSDVYLDNITARYTQGKNNHTLYLQTSPEYAMKRLLASGSGSIYEITKAFRNDESGHLHSPEFSLLEWYRLGFTHHDLMDEMDLLLQTTIQSKPAKRISYQNLFKQHFAIDPHTCDTHTCINLLKENQINLNEIDTLSKDTALQLLLSHKIEPTLGFDCPIFLYDYPCTQAALAKIENQRALRFEVYIHGIELANGFYELTDADEQLKRFKQDNQARQAQGLKPADIDERLIAALKHGLPEVSGVALGLDRLLMIKVGAANIREVIAFLALG